MNVFITPLERYPLSARPAMVFYSLWFYLEKTLLPQGLSPLYELPLRVSLLDRRFLFPPIAVTAITASRCSPSGGAGPRGLAVWAYYAIALGPMIGIVHSGHQLTNDRYSYLPGFGFAIIVGAAAERSSGGRGWSPAPSVGRGAGHRLVWFCGLAYLSAQQIQIWRDTETLWSTRSSRTDCSICRGNLGIYLMDHGHHQAAKTEFERAKELRPESKKVHSIWDTRSRCSTIFHGRSSISNCSSGNTRTTPKGSTITVPHSSTTGGRRRPWRSGARAPGQAQTRGRSRQPERTPFDLRDRRRTSLFREAVALKYDSPQAWFGLARVNLQSGNVDAAAHKACGFLGQIDPGTPPLGPRFIPTW